MNIGFGVASSLKNGSHFEGIGYEGDVSSPCSGILIKDDEAAPSSFPNVLSFSSFLPRFSRGALMTFHRAPQFAVGISLSLFTFGGATSFNTTEFVLGGRAGGGRGANPGGVGTTNPESLKTIVE